MIVYLVMRLYENGADSWESVVEVFSDKGAAELRAAELYVNQEFRDEYTFEVDEWEVK